MLLRPGFKSFETGVRHAHVAKLAVDGGKKAYEYFIKKHSDGTSYLKKRKMAPIKRQAKRRRVTVSQAPNKRAPPQTKAASFSKGKRNTFRKPKKVKLPKGFKAKVQKALADKEINGSWKQVSFDNISATQFATNQQIVVGLAQAVANDHSNWAFDPEDILHAASVLFNDKADNQNGREWWSADNLGIRVNPGNLRPVNGSIPQVFQPMDLKITVKSCHELYKLKNNTQRTIYAKIYLCSPRHPGSKETTWAPDVDALPNQAQPIAPIDQPPSLWINAMNHQAECGINVGGSTPNILYSNPKSNPIFNKAYKSDVTIVTLEPGQVYDYYIPGPSNMTLNYNNLFRGQGAAEATFFMGIRPFMRYPLLVAYQDLITDGTRSGRYPGSVATAANNAISIERTMKMNIVMPEKTGGKANFLFGEPGVAIGEQYELGSRRDCYFHKVYTPTGPTEELTRIDVENPPIEVDQN